MKYLEATDSNGTELYLFQLEGNLFISVPKDQLEFKPLSLEEMKGLEKGEWIDKGWKGDWQYETDGRGSCWSVFECSVCNGWNTIKTRFCPHCVAQMKGAEDE